MTVKMHPDPDLLVDYSAGSLSPAMCVSISAHLHFCESCRVYQTQLECIGGSLLEDAPVSELRASALDDLMLTLDNSDAVKVTGSDVKTQPVEGLERVPELIQNLFVERAPKWSFLSPSLQVARIPVGEERYELALHKIKAGGKTPNHDHKGMEITVVLQGSFSDGDGIYNEGDFLVRQPGDIHRPIASQNELCICVSVVEAPIRLVGSISRLLNPFFSFNPQ